jgi:hypothetical protein
VNWTQGNDTKVQASNRQVHLLIQAFKDRSKGWWMRLKIYSPKGYLVSIDFWVVVGWKQKIHRIHDSNAQSPHSRRQLTRVNSANVLDEGLRIGGRGRQMNSKVKISQTRECLVCVKNKRDTQFAQSQSVPG